MNLSATVSRFVRGSSKAIQKKFLTSSMAKEPLNATHYALGFVSGVGMYAAGRYISKSNEENTKQYDYSSQEFRDQSLNQGMYEALAGGLEWGGLAWTSLVAIQVLEHQMAVKPILAAMGAPRVALLITASACAGFAIRGEEKLIGAARKKLYEKGEVEYGGK